jgi:NAD(P)-dependent dehydrogenase (short-subunit alcohol dehydrogenase family)
MLLAGKLALITGEGSDIGAAIARAIAENRARVIVADVNQAGAAGVASAIGPNAAHCVLHVSIRAACDALAEPATGVTLPVDGEVLAL